MCEGFRNDVLVLHNQSSEEFNKIFDFMNSIDTTGKFKFTISVAAESALDFLDF